VRYALSCCGCSANGRAVCSILRHGGDDWYKKSPYNSVVSRFSLGYIPLTDDMIPVRRTHVRLHRAAAARRPLPRRHILRSDLAVGVEQGSSHPLDMPLA
jgi:hypothetical protein